MRHILARFAEGIRLALNVEVDTVLCPSEDGGFTALGKGFSQRFARGAALSTSKALASTQEALVNAGLSVRLFYPNFDIDRIDDLHKLEVLVANDPGRVPAVEQWISQWRDEAHLGLAAQSKVWYRAQWKR